MKYTVSGSYYITPGTYKSKAAAVRSIVDQLPNCVRTVWPDGSLAFYRDRTNLIQDDTGERAVAVISPVKDDQ